MADRRYPITPRPYARRTHQGRFSPNAKKYHLWMNQLAILQFWLPNEAYVTLEMPMFPSWSKKKTAELDGQPHGQTPDLDNLVKAICDVARRESGDHDIHTICARKIWAKEGGIIVHASLDGWLNYVNKATDS